MTIGPIETQMLRYIESRLGEGTLAVERGEILAAVVPADHPECRDRPSYRFALDRLLRRHVINAVRDRHGQTHYFIGPYPPLELLASLGIQPGDVPPKLKLTRTFWAWLKSFFAHSV